MEYQSGTLCTDSSASLATSNASTNSSVFWFLFSLLIFAQTIFAQLNLDSTSGDIIQEGFIMRTPRGREVTEKAYKHLGKIKTNIQGGLF